MVQNLRFRPVLHLIGRQRHAHGRRQKRSAALGHHVGDGLGHLLVAVTGHILHPDGVDAPVQNPDRARLIPGHIFIAEQKAHAFISAYHGLTVLSFPRSAPA